MCIQALANNFSNETGVKLDVLNPLESLTEEDMRRERTILAMEKNLKALTNN